MLYFHSLQQKEQFAEHVMLQQTVPVILCQSGQKGGRTPDLIALGVLHLLSSY